jgi:flavodoxin
VEIAAFRDTTFFVERYEAPRIPCVSLTGTTRLQTMGYSLQRWDAGGRWGMKILIVHASRRGSAADIAERVGDVFREAGHDVVVWTACEMPSPRNYALVVVGGAVHAGRVVGDLQRYVTQYRGELASKRVALFAVAGNLCDDTEENHRAGRSGSSPSRTRGELYR